MAKIIVFGDVHGQFEILKKQIEHAEKNFDVYAYIQVGDFGIFKPMNNLPDIDIPFCFVIGNHEDEDAETQIPDFPSDYHYLTPDKIHYIDGLKVIGISRSAYMDEWNTPPHGVIKESDIAKAKLSEHADLIVTHDCPKYVHVTSTFFGPQTDVGSEELNEVFDSKTPEFWFFGHHHKNLVAKIKETLFCCFDKIEYGYGVFDTERKTVEFISNTYL